MYKIQVIFRWNGDRRQDPINEPVGLAVEVEAHNRQLAQLYAAEQFINEHPHFNSIKDVPGLQVESHFIYDLL